MSMAIDRDETQKGNALQMDWLKREWSQSVARLDAALYSGNPDRIRYHAKLVGLSVKHLVRFTKRMAQNDSSATGAFKARDSILTIPIDDLRLTGRSTNCLKAENIYLVGDLIKRTHADLLKTPNLGRRSLMEIVNALADLGLTLSVD